MKKQTGAVLIVALIMLLVISIISFTSISIPTMQEQLNVISEDQQLAFQRAEQGLRAAEKAIEALAPAEYAAGGGCALQNLQGVIVAADCLTAEKAFTEGSVQSGYRYLVYLTSLMAGSTATSAGGGYSLEGGIGQGAVVVEAEEPGEEVYVFRIESEGYSSLTEKKTRLKALYVIK